MLLSPVVIDVNGALVGEDQSFLLLLASYAASRRESSPQQELRDFYIHLWDLDSRFTFFHVMQEHHCFNPSPAGVVDLRVPYA